MVPKRKNGEYLGLESMSGDKNPLKMERMSPEKEISSSIFRGYVSFQGFRFYALRWFGCFFERIYRNKT